jgi:hypothetical protein
MNMLLVQRVARKAAHAEQGGFRLCVRADGADVGLAEAVDLHGANHGVAPAAPEQRKCSLVGHPAFGL